MLKEEDQENFEGWKIEPGYVLPANQLISYTLLIFHIIFMHA